MGLRSLGHDAYYLMSTMTLAFLWSLMLQLAVNVAAESESDIKARRKVLCYHSLTGNRSIYDFQIADLHGKNAVDWSLYRGNVVLLVNVASF